MRRSNLDPLEDPDYTLIVKVHDMGGASDMALSGNTRVHIAVQPNLWVNPGMIAIQEHLEGSYPRVITKVRRKFIQRQTLHNDPSCCLVLGPVQ